MTNKKGDTSMIKNFIFDMGNVIIQWNPTYIVQQYIEDPQVVKEIEDTVFKSQEWLDYDCGTITKEKIKEVLSSRVEKQYQDIVKEMLEHWYMHCPIIKGMIPIIQELKEKGYGIYLLSNTNDSFEEYKHLIETFIYFDGFYISAKTKLVKPSVAIFQDFIKTFNLHMEECVFIDDMLVNVEGARKAGMQGYHFDGDIDKFKEYLVSHILFKEI